MPYFKKKPVVIEAVELTRKVTIDTLEGEMVGNPGEILITGVAGEQYVCKPDIFEQTYESVTIQEIQEHLENKEMESC